MVNHNSIRSRHRYVKKTQGYVNWEDFFRKQKFIQYICIGKHFLFFREILHLTVVGSPLNEKGPCTVPSGRFNEE